MLQRPPFFIKGFKFVFERLILQPRPCRLENDHIVLRGYRVGIQFFSALLYFLCCIVAVRFQIYLTVLAIPNNTIYM